MADEKTSTLEVVAGTGITITPDSTNDSITVKTPDTKAAIQADIDTIKVAIDDLKEKGEDLFAEEIANLNTKLKSLTTEVKDSAESITGELLTLEQSFIQKYGQNIAHGLEITLLTAVLGKLFGII